MEDYVAAMAGNRVTKTVFLETDCAKDQLEVEAGFVGKLCADPAQPVAGAVIGCSIDSDALVSVAFSCCGAPASPRRASFHEIPGLPFWTRAT